MTESQNNQNMGEIPSKALGTFNPEQWATAILEGLTEGCFNMDANSTINFWNKKAEHLFSLSSTAVVGKNFWEICEDTLAENLIVELRQALETNKAVTFEAYLEEPNIWVDISAIPSVNGLFVYLKNVTERKLVLEQLEKEQKKYNDLFNMSPVPQWVYEVGNFKFLDVNEAAIKHYGYSRAEFMNMTIKDIRPSEEIPFMLSVFEKIKPGRFSTTETIHQKKNGEIIMVTVEGNSVQFGNENARLVTVIDRTLEIKNSEALKESVNRYNTVSKATSDAICEWNLLTNEMVWNQGIKDLFGHPKISYSNSWWQEHIHPEDLERVLMEFERVIHDKKNRLKIEYRLLCADGSYSVVFDRSYISYNKKGIPVRAISSIQDISDQVATLKDLEDKNKRLREITWIQSHKIKDPLVKLMSIISLMKMNDTDLVAINEMIPMLKHLGNTLDVALKEIAEKSM